MDYGTQSGNIDKMQMNSEIQDMNDEEQLERMLFTKADSVTMKRLLQQEGDQSQKLQSEPCRQKQCE